MRFFAFLAVFMAHVAPRPIRASLPWLGPVAPLVDSAFRAGLYGVDLFFVLSAYLITGLLMREAESQGRIAIGAFYARRALRIWPLYYFAIAFAVFVVPRIIVDDFSGPHPLAFSLFAGNWSTVLFGGPKSVAAPLWSISVEEQFYLAWPLLIAAFGVRRLPHIAVGALVVTFAARAIIMLDGERHDLWNNTFTRLDSIALGALLAVLTRRGVPSLSPRMRLSLAGAGLLTWVVAAHQISVWPGPQVSFPLVSLASAAMLVASLDPPAGRRSLLAHPRLVYHFLERPFLKLKARWTVVPSRPDTNR